MIKIQENKLLIVISFEEIIVYKINVAGSHSNKPKKLKIIDCTKSYINEFNADWQKVKLVEILKMFYLQDSTLDDLKNLKGLI